MERIVTDRLILRPFEAGDLDLVYRIYSDGEILKYSPFDPVDETGARELLGRYLRGWKEDPVTEREFAVIEKKSGEKIGRCHIQLGPEESAMIGWFLVQEAWGRGYATEMTKALLDCCFGELKIHRVRAICNPDNPASWRVMEKCGMRREGFFRQKCRYLKGGKVSWEDELEYGILSSER